MGYEETRKRALIIEQLRMVADADLEDVPSLVMARDLFILSYYLRGIPFIDLAYLRKTDIHDNVLCYRRSKTGRMLTITLEPWMWEIIERYLCDDSNSPYLLRIIRQPGSILEERRQYESALRLYNNGLLDDYCAQAPCSKEERETRFNTYCTVNSDGTWWGCFGKILNDNWEMTY